MFLKYYGYKLTFGLSLVYMIGGLLAINVVSTKGDLVNSSAQYVYMIIIASMLLALWLLLMSFYLSARNYTGAIKGSLEEPAFTWLTRGGIILYISLVITAYLGLLRTLLLETSFHKILTVTQYYLAAALAAYYFYNFGKAGWALAVNVGKQRLHRLISAAIALVVITVALFSWLIIITDRPLGANHILSYVSSNIILLTLFVPLVVAWLYGLFGAYGIYLYQQHNTGVVYKRAMIWLTMGTVALVFISITRQVGDYVLGAASPATMSWDFPRIALLLAVAILSIYSMRRGIGYLHKIEEAT